MGSMILYALRYLDTSESVHASNDQSSHYVDCLPNPANGDIGYYGIDASR
jgi:hypothetical protein